MIESSVAAGLTLALLVAVPACHSERADPVPEPAKFDLASAPPGARGARAAGTDAAPPAPSEGEFREPSSDEDEEQAQPSEEPAPSEDAGPSNGPPDAAPGVAL